MSHRKLLATCILCSAVLCATASWENPPPARMGNTPGPSVTPRTQTPQRQGYTPKPVVMPRTQAPQRITYTPPAPPPPQRVDPQPDTVFNLYSQHLDVDTRHRYTFGVAYTADTEFGDFGSTDIIETDLEFRLFRFNEFLFGSFDAWVTSRLLIFVDNPDIDALPDAVLEAAFDIGQVWRFMNGWSMEFRIAPGIYSDITEPTFGIPITMNFYFAVNPELSLLFGGTLRPSWDIPVMPNVGLAWQPLDVFRLEAMLPKSRVALFPDHVIELFGTFEWHNVTYGLADKENFPDEFTLDDMRATAGVALRPFGDFTITGEIGTYLQREMSADVESSKAFDLSKEPFFRVSIKGAF